MSNELETPAEMPATPDTPVVEVLPNTTEDKPLNLTQAKLDDIIKRAMGRAGAVARQEAEALRVENARLKDAVTGTASTDELERTKGELAAERLRNQAVLDASVRQQRDLVIAEQANTHGFIDSTTLQQLTRQNLRHNTETNSFEVVDDSGNPRLNAAGEPLSVSDFFSDYSNRKPFLVRGVVKSGTGSSGSHGSVGSSSTEIPLEKIFGPGSDARLANQVALRNGGRDYARLKIAARKKGLVD